jgi:hypothetical protein
VRFTIAFIILFAGVAQAQAQEWVLGLGYADFSSGTSKDTGLIAFEVHAEPFYERGAFELSLAGALVGHSSGDVFAGVGLSGLLALEGRWFIEGSVMPGYYRASTPQNGLGSDFEIRSLLGIGYTLKSGDRVSLAITHKSNAATSAVNPGVNAIELRLRRKF